MQELEDVLNIRLRLVDLSTLELEWKKTGDRRETQRKEPLTTVVWSFLPPPYQNQVNKKHWLNDNK